MSNQKRSSDVYCVTYDVNFEGLPETQKNNTIVIDFEPEEKVTIYSIINKINQILSCSQALNKRKVTGICIKDAKPL